MLIWKGLLIELFFCDDFKNKYFSINGTYLNYIDDYRVDSDVFDIHFVEDNVFNVPPGNTKAVCSGYYFFLKPLPKGSYDIRVGGSCSIGTTVVDVIWHLTIAWLLYLYYKVIYIFHFKKIMF